METIKLELNAKGHGAFLMLQGQEKMGEMIVSTAGGHLTVFHTEIFPAFEGMGLAAKLLAEMIQYSRQHHMKVVPLCPYVYAQFKRHPDLYSDVWQKEGKND